MSDIAIGEVARRSGLRTSALRYYEREGLLPRQARRSGQRRYDASILGRVEVVKLALSAGFTIDETRLFLSGFSENTPPSDRWRALAVRKAAQLDAETARISVMKALLDESFRCACPSMADCENLMARSRRSTDAQPRA